MRPASATLTPFAKATRQAKALERAWNQVRANATQSPSNDTRAEAKAFELDATSKLKSIQSRLAKESFVFKPSKGLTLGIKNRPVVVAPIESRIVQRAILDTIQAIPEVKQILHTGFNFGGIDGPGYGVQAAVAKAVGECQKDGYFIRTDIKSFFVDVPRNEAAQRLAAHFSHDPAFKKLFDSAIKTEIIETARLDGLMGLFPLADAGVAQGSCLSPLLCNYLLHDFDMSMNARNVVCIRYIDDFILFAPNKKAAQQAFDSGLVMLGKLGLKAYNPFDPADVKKAEHGRSSHGFNFLGCEIMPTSVRPSKEKQQELIESVKTLYDNCIKSMKDPQAAVDSANQILSFAGTALAASRTVRGWGNSYAFCSDDRLMMSLDIELDKQLIDFRKRFTQATATFSPAMRRRALGVFALSDCRKDDSPGSARSLAKAAARSQ